MCCIMLVQYISNGKLAIFCKRKTLSSKLFHYMYFHGDVCAKIWMFVPINIFLALDDDKSLLLS